MEAAKPLFVLWSRAAFVKAGPTLTALQQRLLKDAAEIVAQAHDWFLHALPGETEGDCYTCTGNELPDRWKIFVQIARYKPLSQLPHDYPDPKRRGQIVKFPEKVGEPDNEKFLPFEDLID